MRWLDDPAEDNSERSTRVWRALLALGAFFATQALTLRLLRVFELPAGYTLAGTLGASAVALALFNRRSSDPSERARWNPRRGLWWLAGLIGGIASGSLAVQVVKYLHGVGSSPVLSSGEWIALCSTMVAINPLVEEYFRAWLQNAIAQDLPPTRRQWAFALTAAAFALAHVDTYGAPQLLLGLVAGALFDRSRGLLPSVIAHAAHNAVVLMSFGAA